MKQNVTVLYATMTGNARDCAEKVASALNSAGISAEAVDLAQYNPKDLLEETRVAVTISTWGEGEPPDDGVNFYDYLKTLEAPSLENLQFAVFALGDTSYEEFCKCGKDIDQMFSACGGKRLLDCVENDIDFTDALDEWTDKVVEAMKNVEAVA